jgi:hypothetical protein
LGGDSFKIRLDAAAPTVGEAKAEIARVQGTKAECQELYRVAVREDGGAVREDDAEPELLDDEDQQLEDGSLVAMAVKEAPLVWRTFPEEALTLSEGGAVATQVVPGRQALYQSIAITTGVELTEGRHYWEVELLSEDVDYIYVGVSRPNLDPEGHYMGEEHCTDAWFLRPCYGCLFGNGRGFGINGKYSGSAAGGPGAGYYEQGDRVGVLLDLNNGSLLFFKNGVQFETGLGYPAGSVTGTVVAAVEMGRLGEAVRLHGDIAFPAGHAQ